MKQLLFGTLFVCLLMGSVYAQNTNADKNAFSAKVLFVDYGTPNSIDDLEVTNGLELAYIRNLTPWLNFALPVKVGLANVEGDINNRNFASIDGVLQLQYAKSDSSRLVPYLMGGGGYTFERDGNANLQTPLGAGLNIRVGGRSYVNIQGEYRLSQEENRDNLQLGIGYLHKLGKSDADGDGIVDALDRCPNDVGSSASGGCPDQDMDGIADLDDKCPARPGKKRFGGCPDTDEDGIADDEDECPELAGEKELAGCPDGDKDGIADKDDKCPEEKGSEATDGCPDQDGDGIADKDDLCPEEKGTAEFNGCPFADQDKDGVADEKDNCPEVAGTKKANGCPDQDDDGVADKDDLCPGEKGTAEFNGCPDTDGDGVHDGIDACVNDVGPSSNKGCPEIEEEDQKLLDFAMQAVQFETGKATLKTSSYETLDQIVDILNRYPAYELQINGHTDSVGDSENNQALSEKRAKACYDYILNKGIVYSRIAYRGYGESQPRASNKSSKGRRLNRRVEFNLYIE
jgi:OOP family OmpA-OmpF porin